MKPVVGPIAWLHKLRASAKRSELKRGRDGEVLEAGLLGGK